MSGLPSFFYDPSRLLTLLPLARGMSDLASIERMLDSEANAKPVVEGGAPESKQYPSKPKLSKAERRAIQERQRAEKAEGKKGGGKGEQGQGQGQGSGATGKASKKQSQDSQGGAKEKGKVGGNARSPQDQNRIGVIVQLFSHLADYNKGATAAALTLLRSGDIHPSISALGQQYADGSICGANSRVISMLESFKDIVLDYTTPPDKMLSWDLDKKLRPQIQYLIDCRPHSISMGNSIKFVRNIIAKVPPDMPEREAKAHICHEIDTFVQERIIMAGEGVAGHGIQKIRTGDVILTYGSSSVVKRLLVAAKTEQLTFQVVMVDSRPGLEGKTMAAALSEAGIKVTYVLLNALSYIMQGVTKVFIGASALMANGGVLAKVGTATVAMVARSSNIPVLVCCETYKFCEKFQLDSIVYNELGHPGDLLLDSEEGAAPQETPRSLKTLNLRYDLTPSRFVSLVVTELGLIPPTSVPVLLREMTKREDREA